MQSRGAVPGSGRSLFKAYWWICGVHDKTYYLTSSSSYMFRVPSIYLGCTAARRLIVPAL